MPKLTAKELETLKRLLDASASAEEPMVDGFASQLREIASTLDRRRRDISLENTAVVPPLDPHAETSAVLPSSVRANFDAIKSPPSRFEMSASLERFRPGDPLPGHERYRLVELLGKGGVGEVWLTHDDVLKRNVAVKVLRSDRDHSLDSSERFVYEARATGRLAHPGIIPVYDCGRLPDGRWYYSMQRITGRTLGEVLKAIRACDMATIHANPLPRLLAIFSQLCNTIAYAHDHGFIHRDLKPENVLLGAYGEVYVADWGLAKCYDPELMGSDELRPSRNTDEGTILGTLYYMSPEQLEGDASKLTPATDVWALGCILYELLTLSVPFQSKTPVSLMFKIVSELPPDPRDVAGERDVPWKMAQLALESLDRNAGNRPSALTLAQRVSAFLDGVEEKRRRTEQANDKLQGAMILLDQYRATRADIDAQHAAAESAATALTLDSSTEERESTWSKQQAVDDRELEMDQLFTRIMVTANQSIGVNDNDDAHRLLADLYWQKVVDAEAAQDWSNWLFFRSQVQQHDRGYHTAALQSTGALSWQTIPLASQEPASQLAGSSNDVPQEQSVSPASDLATLDTAELAKVSEGSGHEVRVQRFVPHGPVLRLEDADVRNGDDVPVGHYLLTYEPPGGVAVHLPVHVRNGESVSIRVAGPATFAGAHAYCFVPGGTARLGGDPGAIEPLADQVVDFAPFFIATDLVTVGDYVAFLNAISTRDGADVARKHCPRSADGTVLWLDLDVETGVFAVPTADRDGDAWHPDWPVVMISWHDAVAYCEWQSTRDDAIIRLPTEFEWEYACRGVDRRVYPWGNGFDPTLCRMVDSVDGKHVPMPVGSYPFDTSPFGVRDMAGLAVEWTATPDGQHVGRYVQRGGGLFSPATWCRAASRKSNAADYVSVQFGFRVVREIEASAADISRDETSDHATADDE